MIIMVSKNQKLEFIRTLIICGSLTTTFIAFIFSTFKEAIKPSVSLIPALSTGYFVFIFGSILMYIIILLELRSRNAFLIATYTLAYGFSALLSIPVSLFADAICSLVFYLAFGTILSMVLIKIRG